MVEKRDKPRVWVTWLAAYLAGDEQCDWKLWFKSNHRYSRPSRDLSDWETQHSAMVNSCAAALKEQGFRVTIEQQNEFTIQGNYADVAGKPDIIAQKETTVLVVDCKTGNEREYHKIQVLLYLWALSKDQKYRGARFHGEVRYNDGRTAQVSFDQLTEEFERRIIQAILKVVNAPHPPEKKPSPSECRLCEIPAEYCSERSLVQPNVVKTDQF